VSCQSRWKGHQWPEILTITPTLARIVLNSTNPNRKTTNTVIFLLTNNTHLHNVMFKHTSRAAPEVFPDVKCAKSMSGSWCLGICSDYSSGHHKNSDYAIHTVAGNLAAGTIIPSRATIKVQKCQWLQKFCHNWLFNLLPQQHLYMPMLATLKLNPFWKHTTY